jgi:alkylated DNA nucleotide flippase Atl1
MITAGRLRIRHPDRMTTDSGEQAEDIPDLASAVLDVVDLIPPGKVMTYGDVAEYLGRCGPRQVGNVLARWGGAVAWWRVLKADGSPPPGHEARALAAYRAERTPLRAGGAKVDLRRARWDGEPA